MQKTKITFAYKTGFRRAWLVGSVIWFIAVSVFFHDFNGAAKLIATIGLIPPVVMYALGVALVWIIEGFARADQ